MTNNNNNNTKNNLSITFKLTKEVKETYKNLFKELKKINSNTDKIHELFERFIGTGLVGIFLIEKGTIGFDFMDISQDYKYSGMIGGLKSLKHVAMGDKSRKEHLLNFVALPFDTLLSVLTGTVMLAIVLTLGIPTGICLLAIKGYNSFAGRCLNSKNSSEEQHI